MAPVATSKQLSPPSTLDRYFSQHYGAGLAARLRSDSSAPRETPGPGEDTCVARHHNGLCVLCISPSHPIVKRQLDVASVAFREGGFRAVQGKRKRGGTFVDRDTRIACIVCRNGESYLVQGSVRGVLVEINTTLEKQPSLVASKPLTNGYLAVILPSRTNRATSCDALLDRDPAEEGHSQ